MEVKLLWAATSFSKALHSLSLAGLMDKINMPRSMVWDWISSTWSFDIAILFLSLLPCVDPHRFFNPDLDTRDREDTGSDNLTDFDGVNHLVFVGHLGKVYYFPFAEFHCP